MKEGKCNEIVKGMVYVIQRRPEPGVKAVHRQILKSCFCLQATLSKCVVCRGISSRSSYCMHIVILGSVESSRSFPFVGLHCTYCRKRTDGLVRALSLDVAWLLALVASSLVVVLNWAVSGEMTDLTTVVALLALGAVT